MVGTKEGGEKARNTVWESYGNDFYRKIGQKGGLNNIEKNGGGTSGFGKTVNPSKAGSVGGKLGRKTRSFEKGSTLDSKEIRICVELAEAIWKQSEQLEISGKEIKKSYDSKEHFVNTVSQHVLSQDWEWVFSDCGLPAHVATFWWSMAIAASWSTFIIKIAKGTETPEDKDDYRAVRTLGKAFDIANNTSTAWYARAKRTYDRIKDTL